MHRERNRHNNNCNENDRKTSTWSPLCHVQRYGRKGTDDGRGIGIVFKRFRDEAPFLGQISRKKDRNGTIGHCRLKKEHFCSYVKGVVPVLLEHSAVKATAARKRGFPRTVSKWILPKFKRRSAEIEALRLVGARITMGEDGLSHKPIFGDGEGEHRQVDHFALLPGLSFVPETKANIAVILPTSIITGRIGFKYAWRLLRVFQIPRRGLPMRKLDSWVQTLPPVLRIRPAVGCFSSKAYESNNVANSRQPVRPRPASARIERTLLVAFRPRERSTAAVIRQDKTDSGRIFLPEAGNQAKAHFSLRKINDLIVYRS